MERQQREAKTRGESVPPLSTPVPDPTVLTTAALTREIASLKEIVFTRLDGMDEAVKLFHAALTRTPTDVDKQISHLKALHSEKFDGVQLQFKERDTRAEQISKDSKVAVDAALQAAKEAVGEQNKSSSLAIAKSEAATTKQIDQIALLISATNKATDGKINDLKERLDRGGGVDNGKTIQRESTQKNNSMIIAAIATIISVGSLITTIVLAIARNMNIHP